MTTTRLPLLLAGSIVVLAAGPLAAQSVDASLKQSVEARTQARQKHDIDTWSTYVSSDALFTNADGGLETKADRMKAMKTETPPAAPRISDEKYRVYGSAAVRTFRQDSAAGPRRWIEVYVKEAGAWKLVSLQFTTIKP